MVCNIPRRFRKNLLTLAACAAVAPQVAWALDLASGPPGTKEPYVAPNVILSLDDSGSMKGTKEATLRAALKEVFNDTGLLPDGKIRLAWQDMNKNTSVEGLTLTRPLTDAAAAGTSHNAMRVLDDTHRANFLRYVEAFTVNNGTPTHDMAKGAYDYMKAALHKNGPWADVPGSKLADASNDNKPLGCRRNYHILLTDGGWNGTARPLTPINYDGAERTLPDGTLYSNTSAKNRLYRDGEDRSTIADWAFKSWAEQLQLPANLTGSVQPSVAYRKAPATETFKNRATGATATLDRFWNPRYNPATWPHMVTFTIGFGNDALPKVNYLSVSGRTWADMTTPTSMLPYGYDGNLADYANGTYSWRAYGASNGLPSGGGTHGGPPSPKETDSTKPIADRGHDMWHAALNGRGEFYAVAKNEDLKKAFQSIIGTINTENEPETTSTAASGSNASRSDVGTYTGAYEPANGWKGFVRAETVNKNGTISAAWGGKNTAELLDAVPPANRVILSWSDQLLGTTSAAEKGGVAFRWESGQTTLSTAQKAKLGLNTSSPRATSAEDILGFVRGVRGYEGPEAGGDAAKPFRKRHSAQGDIINSGVWYTGAPTGTYALQGYSGFVRAQKGRTPMIYVGGNDGMLHGFDASTGQEKVAYVPQGVLPTLKDLASVGYPHKYYVDGSPMTGDVELGGVATLADGSSAYVPDWRTLLVGTLGAGGKGYFVLDVTNPASGSNSKASSFAEANAANLAKLDRTRGAADARSCAALANGSAEKTFCEQAAEEDKDIGHITAKPVLDENDPMRTTQITLMNNEHDNGSARWAVVLGNGYNSTNQRPVLLIQYLDGDKELVRIPVTTEAAGVGKARDNGLSAPRLVDLNGDGRVDVAYAGDNQGNLWKFDLTSDLVSDWGVALGGSPLFTAQGPSSLGSATRGNPQPITVAPTVRANDRQKCAEVTSGVCTKREAVGGMMVAFGAGRNVTTQDPNDVKVQTLYSVLDNARYQVRKTAEPSKKQWLKVCTLTGCSTPTAVAMDSLVKRSITELSIGTSESPQPGRVEEDGDLYVRDANNKLDRTQWLDTKKGWYMDLPAVGERLLKNMELYDNTNILMVYSQVPAKGSNVDTSKESCESTSVDSERQYRTMLNIMDGARPSIQLIDVVGNGSYDAAENQNASRVQVDKGSHSQIAASPTDMLQVSTCKGDKCLRDDPEIILRMPEQSLRPSWRQLR